MMRHRRRASRSRRSPEYKPQPLRIGQRPTQHRVRIANHSRRQPFFHRIEIDLLDLDGRSFVDPGLPELLANPDDRSGIPARGCWLGFGRRPRHPVVEVDTELQRIPPHGHAVIGGDERAAHGLGRFRIGVEPAFRHHSTLAGAGINPDLSAAAPSLLVPLDHPGDLELVLRLVRKVRDYLSVCRSEAITSPTKTP